MGKLRFEHPGGRLLLDFDLSTITFATLLQTLEVKTELSAVEIASEKNGPFLNVDSEQTLESLGFADNGKWWFVRLATPVKCSQSTETPVPKCRKKKKENSYRDCGDTDKIVSFEDSANALFTPHVATTDETEARIPKLRVRMNSIGKPSVSPIPTPTTPQKDHYSLKEREGQDSLSVAGTHEDDRSVASSPVSMIENMFLNEARFESQPELNLNGIMDGAILRRAADFSSWDNDQYAASLASRTNHLRVDVSCRGNSSVLNGNSPTGLLPSISSPLSGHGSPTDATDERSIPRLKALSAKLLALVPQPVPGLSASKTASTPGSAASSGPPSPCGSSPVRTRPHSRWFPGSPGSQGQDTLTRELSRRSSGLCSRQGSNRSSPSIPSTPMARSRSQSPCQSPVHSRIPRGLPTTGARPSQPRQIPTRRGEGSQGFSLSQSQGHSGQSPPTPKHTRWGTSLPEFLPPAPRSTNASPLARWQDAAGQVVSRTRGSLLQSREDRLLKRLSDQPEGRQPLELTLASRSPVEMKEQRLKELPHEVLAALKEAHKRAEANAARGHYPQEDSPQYVASNSLS